MQESARPFDAGDHAGPARPIEILQVGDGNFLRGFLDWMVDVANEKGVYGGGVAMAKARPGGIAKAFAEQHCRFTVLLRGREAGQEVVSRRLVSSVQIALDPYAEWPKFLDIASAPSLRFVVSNTTEAGIADLVEPYDPQTCPQSFPAKVSALLHARYRALGAAAAPGLVFLPCELIEGNGAELRRIVLLHAQRWALGADFIAWVEGKNLFLDTLVDRIVPGFPAAEAEKLFAEWGYRDPLTVAAEPFHVWVIQGPAEIAAELPLDKAGLNVIWTDDLRPYRASKVRILNGAHTSVALAAYLAGLDTVEQTMADPLVSRFLREIVFDEIAPRVPLPPAERQAYAETVLERFDNPFIRHELISIALNSVSKWKVRVLPTVKDALAENAKAPRRLAFSLAALLWFYRGRKQDGVYIGHRGANDEPMGDYPIRDDAAILDIMAQAWSDAAPDESRAIALKLLADARLWGEDLTLLGDLAVQAADGVAAIERHGMRGALERLEESHLHPA